MAYSRCLELSLFWEGRHLVEVIPQHLPMSISSMTKLNLHLVENGSSFTGSHEMNQHVFNREMLCSEFCSNKRHMGQCFVAKRHATAIICSQPLFLQVFLKTRLEN